MTLSTTTVRPVATTRLQVDNFGDWVSRARHSPEPRVRADPIATRRPSRVRTRRGRRLLRRDPRPRDGGRARPGHRAARGPARRGVASAGAVRACLSRRCVDRFRACVEDGPAVRSSKRELIVGIGAAVAVAAVSVLAPASALRRPRWFSNAARRSRGMPVAVWLLDGDPRRARVSGRCGPCAAVLAVTLSFPQRVLYSPGGWCLGREARWST